MKKSIAMKWVKALRSGEYKQGQPGVLSDGQGGFCCLGVLCQVSHISPDDCNRLPDEDDMARIAEAHEDPEVLGIELSLLNDGYIKLDDCRNTAAVPEQRLSFDEIADLIQINYEEL